MHPLIEKLIALANSKVGVKEIGGNNRGPEIVEFQKATWLAPDAWAWCAAFCCWLLREWVKDAEVQKHFGVSPLAANTWRCRDASAFGWVKWGTDKKFYITDEKELAKAGDFVVFDFSHIGIVERDQLPNEDVIHTIEGNTNGKGERDSVTGDGVWKKVRKTNLVKKYIRLIAE